MKKKHVTYQELVEAIKANNNQVINDNPSGAQKIITLTGVMGYEYKGRIIPVGMFPTPLFSLNEVYLTEDGTLHISQYGTCGFFERKEGDTLEESIIKFNNSVPRHQRAAGKIIVQYTVF